MSDVVIAGAGIAGSTLAVALARGGFNVVVVDPGQPAAAPGPPRDIHEIEARVSALSPASVHLLERLGVWSQIATSSRCAYSTMHVWDADGTGKIEFHANEIPISDLGCIVENTRITAALHAVLAAQNSARMCFSRSVKALENSADGRVLVHLDDGDTVNAGVLIGADGARSAVRNMANIDSTDQDCGQSAIVCTARTSQVHQSTAWQVFRATGPLAFLPLRHFDDDYHSSIVWSADQTHAQKLIELDDAQFTTALEEAFERRLGSVEAVSRRVVFPLVQRNALSYVRTGVALVGDAAHSIHPLAGQGINLGLTDVNVLVEEFERARRRGQQLGALVVLGRYNRRRLGDARLMLEAMRGLQLLFGHSAIPARIARNIGLNCVSQLPPLKRLFMRHAMGV